MSGRGRYWSVGFAIAAVILAAFAHRSIKNELASRRSCTLGQVSKMTGLRFPSSAKLLDSQYNGLTAWRLGARVVMARADVNKFLASLPKARKISSRDQLGVSDDLISMRLPWLTPNTAHQFIAARFDGIEEDAYGHNAYKRLSVFADTEDPKIATACIFCESEW